MRNNHFPGWARPYEFAAELLTGLGKREEEARDMARRVTHRISNVISSGPSPINSSPRPLVVLHPPVRPCSLHLHCDCRVALRLPWWTLQGTYEAARDMAQLKGSPAEVR